MLRRAAPADLPAIVSLLTASNDEPYDLAPAAAEKIGGRGIDGDPVVTVHETGRVIDGVAVSCGPFIRLLAVARGSRRRGIGSSLLGSGTVAAAEPGNYFTPGVSDPGTIAFLEACGFVAAGETWNLHATLSTPAAGTRVDAVRSSRDGRRSEVLAFIEREFGRIWAFEAARAETIFFVEQEGEIAGFSTQEANNRGLGTFGPTGVVSKFRRRGIGALLLAASLDELRRQGYDRAVIPWTDSLEFYARACGARPAHRFTRFVR